MLTLAQVQANLPALAALAQELLVAAVRGGLLPPGAPAHARAASPRAHPDEDFLVLSVPPTALAPTPPPLVMAPLSEAAAVRQEALGRDMAHFVAWAALQDWAECLTLGLRLEVQILSNVSAGIALAR